MFRYWIRPFVLSFLLFAPILLFSQDSIRVEGKVRSATVFFSGAEIERSFEVDLERGSNGLIVEGVSPYIDEKSIRIEGVEGLRIRSVERRIKTKKAEGDLKERIQAKEDSIEDIEFKLSLRNSLKRVYTEEKGMILENKNIKGEQVGVDVEDLMELAVYYRQRLKEIEYKIIEVESDIEDLQEERRELKERLRKLQEEASQRVSRIIVGLEAEQRGRQELTLSYFSSRAGWQPAYELSATSLEEPVRATYKGQVWQRTDRDWEDVELTLASGKPTQSGEQPELNPWWLSFRTLHQKGKRKQSGQKASPRKQQSARSELNVRGSRSSSNEVYVDEEEAGANAESSVHTRFPIDARYSIPSGRSTRSVRIEEMELEAQYDHLTVPKKEPEAFLIAKLSGWESSDLFPGEASIQYGGRYVGKTYIDPEITKDTLEVSLGRDQGVIVDRKKIKDKTSEQLIGGKKILETGVEIELKNRRDEKVDLRVKDQLPLSKRGDVEIELTEDGGAEQDPDSGELSWRVSMESGESRTLNFAYRVKYPKELDPIGL